MPKWHSETSAQHASCPVRRDLIPNPIFMSEVNLKQDPQDFLKQAMNMEGADPKGQPPLPEPGGSQPPAVPPKAEPGTPPAPPTPSVPPENKPEPPKPSADPKGQPKTAEELQKDWENANKKISELGEAKSSMFKTYLGLVEENPNLIKDLHKKDPALADQVVKEHWGHSSFEELMEYARVEELKESDPEAARREEEILNIKRDNKMLLENARRSAETSFYAAKGILNNQFDPKYQAVQEALKKVSSELIRTNYAEALELAHTIAFPGRKPEEIEEEKKRIALGTAGVPESKGSGGGTPSAPSSFSQPQQGFAGMVGAKLI